MIKWRGEVTMPDQAWAASRATPFVYVQRVRPQECAASAMLGHPRFLEFFEAGFIECWRECFGSVDATLGPRRRLTVAEVNVRYLTGVRSDDELRIEVTLDRFTKHSIQVHYEAFVEAIRVAEASTRYVCIDAASREPTSLPDGIAEDYSLWTRWTAPTPSRPGGNCD
jgi:YbgC/YbaW family acyl-CoA thioester hydrolase